MFVDGAIIALIESRVMSVKLRVVKVSVFGLAVWVLVCLVVEEPRVRGVFDLSCTVNIKRICSLTLERRAAVGGQAVVRIPLMGCRGGIREVISLQLPGLRLERTCEVVTIVVGEVIGREGTKPVAAIVCITVLTSLPLIGRQSAIVQVQIEHVAVVVYRRALTPTGILGWKDCAILEVWAVEALLLGSCCDTIT